MFARLENFIFEKMSETKLPSLSMAAIKDGEIIHARAFGFKDVGQGFAATTATLYGIGSVTKSFTALAIMQLSEQGKLSLDDPIDKYVPFSIKPKGETVRISHFLSHTSGIPALAYAEAVIRGKTGAAENWLPIANCSDLLTFMGEAQDWSIARPGEKWFYLNEGYAILGNIIEKCSQMSYEEYVSNYILAPLGMNRSFFAKKEIDSDPDAAIPYVITRNGEQKASTYPFGGISADGALISNVIDLSKYISMYLGLGKYCDNRLLSEESVKLMQIPQISIPYQGYFGERSYAYGLFVTPDFLGSKLIDHGGSVLVSTAFMGFMPDKKIGIVLLANGSGYSLSQLGMMALSSMLGNDPEDLPFVRQEQALTELTGAYETYRGTMKAQIKKMGSFLVIEMKDKYSDSIVPLIPQNIEKTRRTFYTLSSGATLTVEFMVHETGVELIYERYLLRKTGKLL